MNRIQGRNGWKYDAFPTQARVPMFRHDPGTNPFTVTSYEEEIMAVATSGYSDSYGRRGYKIDGREVSYDEWLNYQKQHTRVGRALRDRYLDHLSTMYSEEYLDEGEFQERANAAASAKFESDLTCLITDLKPLPPEPSVPLPPPSEAVAKDPRSLRKKAWDGVRPLNYPGTWSFAALVASLNLTFWPAHWAAAAYHGLGNANPFIFCTLLVVGGVCSLISATATLANWFEW